MFSCDYNGWADVPEEEREAIEAFDAAHNPPARVPVQLVIRKSLHPAPILPQRKAA